MFLGSKKTNILVSWVMVFTSASVASNDFILFFYFPQKFFSGFPIFFNYQFMKEAKGEDVPSLLCASLLPLNAMFFDKPATFFWMIFRRLQDTLVWERKNNPEFDLLKCCFLINYE